MIDRRSIGVLLFLAAASSAWAAEPEVDAKQLPHAPPTEPAQAIATFQVKAGFHLELAAAEPLVVSPVAMCFDEDGRLYVVEMRDYSERRPERLGRIRLLEDTDGDGRFEKSTIFAEGLPWPTAIICWSGGVFVGATPDILYFKDVNGDGKADVKEPIFSGFASDYAPFATNKLNVQALMNSLNWNLDNRIHGATSFSGGKVKLVDTPFVRRWLESAGAPPPFAFGNPSPLELRGRDFSFDPRTLELRPESGGGQHGMSFDSRGRKFVCSNSDHLQWILYEDRYAARHPEYALPNPRLSIAVDGPAAEVYRLSPEEPWRVLRTQWRVSGLVPGPIEGGGRSSGYFTGATGVTLYRGDAFGEEFVDDAFIGDAGSNLVHRKKIRPDGLLLRAERPADEQKIEFLASTDNWFRPVQFANGPDGCLYVADMYREVIEHPWSLPANLKKHLDLNSGNDRGRIYRIAPATVPRRTPPRLGKARTEELVKLLEHPNGWHRETAARLLYERQDQTAPPQLAGLISPTRNSYAVIHGLQALAGLQALTEAEVCSALAHRQPGVRGVALKMAEPFLGNPTERLWAELNRAIERMDGEIPDGSCVIQLAFTLAETIGPRRTELLLALLKKETAIAPTHGTGQGRNLSLPWVESILLSALKTNAFELFWNIASAPRPGKKSEDLLILGKLARSIGARNDANQTARLLALMAKADGTPAARDPVFLSEVIIALEEGLRQSGTTLRALPGGAALETIYGAIRPVASGRSAEFGETAQVLAIRALASAPYSQFKPDLLSLLMAGTNSPAIQIAVVRALAGNSDPAVGRELLGAWPHLTPAGRTEVVSSLLTRPDRLRALLAGLAKGVVQPSDLSLAQQAQLRSARDPAIRDEAIKVLGRPPLSSRSSVIEQFRLSLDRRGDRAKGRMIFQARCASCHKAGNEGHAVGPDLATVTTGGPEKLLMAILDPNREVAPNFASYIVETKDGESLTGILVSENAGGVILRMAGGAETTVTRANIASLQGQGRSLMPEGLEEGLQVQDLADLMEFILGR